MVSIDACSSRHLCSASAAAPPGVSASRARAPWRHPSGTSETICHRSADPSHRVRSEPVKPREPRGLAGPRRGCAGARDGARGRRLPSVSRHGSVTDLRLCAACSRADRRGRKRGALGGEPGRVEPSHHGGVAGWRSASARGSSAACERSHSRGCAAPGCAVPGPRLFYGSLRHASVQRALPVRSLAPGCSTLGHVLTTCCSAQALHASHARRGAPSWSHTCFGAHAAPFARAAQSALRVLPPVAHVSVFRLLTCAARCARA